MRVDGLVWENAEENAIEIKPESVIRVDGREAILRDLWNVTRSRYVLSEMEFEPSRQIWIITARLKSKKK
ncbi:hypothetical protein Tery_2629 [Trichodesmium erythraeum IMS101]|uniref:Uncharacterized protein n=1 Tax=Trichodesmium erythraeum (strain IMS101) TaxID=203124 RepID=Q111K0_TRIEI|nr:hypothetical protein [Trichodesmium erythraeum GBRTRLIN201]MDE5093261.1 hypothetical protein [Trichodesmium sp. St11_bin5]